ncbi:MAG: hypothetical protein EOP09_07930, partial [Proteobacteria bacterium]
FGFYEAGGNPQLPIDIRSVTEGAPISNFKVRIKHWREVSPATLRDIQTRSGQQDRTGWDDKLPDPRSVSIFALEKDVRTLTIPAKWDQGSIETAGIPLDQGSGVYLVEVESARLGKAITRDRKPMFVSAVAVVTPFGVHMKWSREGPFVWVTDLETGKAVKGASVELLDCAGKSLKTGTTDQQGVVQLPGAKAPGRCPTDSYLYADGFFAKVRKGDATSFVYSGWDNGIEPWRFRMNTGRTASDLRYHALLDRNWLRLGDDLHVKFYVRELGSKGFSFLSAKELPTRALFKTLGGKTAATFPIQWNLKNGTAVIDWKIPKDSFQGEHVVELETSKASSTPLTTQVGHFLIGDYRVPKLSTRVQFTSTDADGTVRPVDGRVPLEFSLQYLNGGLASDTPFKIRAEWSAAQATELPNYEGYSFNRGDVESEKVVEIPEDEVEPGEKKVIALDEMKRLNRDGVFTTEIALPKNLKASAYRLLVQFEFKDPNGEIQTISRFASVSRNKEFIAVNVKRNEEDESSGKAQIEALVSDIQGRPVAGREVEMHWLREDYLSHRRKIVGGFYEYESSTERTPLGTICKGKTGIDGKLICESQAKESANYLVVAQTQDSAGEKIVSHD